MRTSSIIFLSCLLIGGCGSSTPEPHTGPADPLRTVGAEDLYRTGRELLAQHDYVRAEQYLAASMERGYDEARVLPDLLESCIASSRMRAALRYAEPYLARVPEAWSLRLLVANIHLGLGHVDRARRELLIVVNDNPDHPAAWYTLGVVHRDHLEDEEGAEEYFARYIELSPAGPHATDALRSTPGDDTGPARGRRPR